MENCWAEYPEKEQASGQKITYVNGGHPGSMGRNPKCFYKGPPGEKKQTEILVWSIGASAKKKVLQICAERGLKT